jgi:hypothetical protein
MWFTPRSSPQKHAPEFEDEVGHQIDVLTSIDPLQPQVDPIGVLKDARDQAVKLVQTRFACL